MHRTVNFFTAFHVSILSTARVLEPGRRFGKEQRRPCSFRVRLSRAKIRAVNNYPQPPLPSQHVHSFTGFYSDHRRFIHKTLQSSHDLFPAFLGGAPLEAPINFSSVVDRLAYSPILTHFDPSAFTELCSDACGDGIEDVLAPC